MAKQDQSKSPDEVKPSASEPGDGQRSEMDLIEGSEPAPQFPPRKYLSREEMEFLTSRAEGRAEGESAPSALQEGEKNVQQRLAELESVRQELEEKLRESEDRFWSFFHGQDAVKMLVDPESSEIIAANEMAASFYGYSRDDLLQMRLTDLCLVPQRLLLRELEKGAQEWGKIYLLRQQTASRAIRDVDVHAGPMSYQGRGLVLCLIYDVSEMKSLELAFREGSSREAGSVAMPSAAQGSRDQMPDREVLLDSIETQIWYHNTPDAYGMVNRTHAEFLGRRKEELEGRSLFDIFDPDTASRLLEENSQVFEQQNRLRLKRWLTNAAGEKRLLLITKFPKINAQGSVEYMICSAQDITKQQRDKEILKKMLHKLESRALLDSLTGIPNRRYLDDYLKREWGRAKREANAISMLMVDIDYFKAYNDHYGHLAGDSCLKRIASVLAETITRSSDIVARYGGEEFAAILPKTDAQGARSVAEAIRKQIKDLDLPHADSPLESKVTVSVGTATIVPLLGISELSKEALIQAADRALYQAKQQGRNMVVCKDLRFDGKELVEES